MFETFRRLLPTGRAWNLVADRMLRRYLEGYSTVGSAARLVVDQVHEDLRPETTRELDEWVRQFDITRPALESDLRDAIAAAWASLRGGQSPRYLQDIVQGAGFSDVYIHEWNSQGGLQYTGDFLAVQPTVTAFAMSASGDRLFTLDGTTVRQINLTVPYQLSSAVAGPTFSVAAQEANPEAIAFDDGGQFMFIGGQGGVVYVYSNGPRWELSGMSYSGDFKDTGFHPQDIRSIRVGGPSLFVLDLYIVGDGDNEVKWWQTHPLDWVPGMTLQGAIGTLGFQAETIGADIADDGLTLYTLGADGTLYAWPLSTPYDVLSAGTPSLVYDFTAEDTSPNEILVSPSYTFMLGETNDAIYRYQSGNVAHDPRDYTNVPLIGTNQCGDTNIECGEPDVVCNRYLANDPMYLWNKDLTLAAPRPVPSDPDLWRFFLYFGGQTFGTLADVPAARRAEFEKLLLKICPAHYWIVTMVNYV